MPYGSIPTDESHIVRRKRGYANDGTQQLHEITPDGVVIRHSQGLFHALFSVFLFHIFIYLKIFFNLIFA